MTVDDLSGPQQALWSEAADSGDPAAYLRAAVGWWPEDRAVVADVYGLTGLAAQLRAPMAEVSR